MTPMSLRHWLAFWLLGLLWGSSFIWNKLALRELGPLTLTLMRQSIGVLVLAGFALWVRPRWPAQRRVWIVLAVLGVTHFIMPHFLVAWGQQYVDAGMASVLNAATPLITLLLAHGLLSDDRLSRGKAIGVVLGFAGVVVLLSTHLFQGQPSTLLGQLSQLGAGLFSAVGAVLARRYTAGYSPVIQALVPMTVADLLLWTIAPVAEAPFALPALPLTWLAVVSLGLLSSGLSYLLFYYLLHSIGPTRTHMVSYVFPLMAVLLGVVLLGERLHWRLIAGGLMILSGIAFANYGVPRPGIIAPAPPRPAPSAGEGEGG